LTAGFARRAVIGASPQTSPEVLKRCAEAGCKHQGFTSNFAGSIGELPQKNAGFPPREVFQSTAGSIRRLTPSRLLSAEWVSPSLKEGAAEKVCPALPGVK
jgi:hypothetical protein